MEIGEDEMVGAIFMCNQATKKECFRSKVFGLPSGYAEFVNKVKAGMLLFLFEYEERKLYGVFEAATDGAINISTSAFSKTKGTFPAQVVFKTIWKCHPLTEDEFKDAIQDNYFAPYKFHFGLSHEQVSMLLDLFSQRKLMPKNQRTADYHESCRLENGNNMIRKEMSASMDETDFGSSLDYEGAVHNQHSELVHKIHGTDLDLRDHLTMDRYRNRDISSDELHTSLDRDSKDKLVGKHTLYTADLVFKNHGDLDNESRPYHTSQYDYQPHNVIGSTSQLDDYFPQDHHRLSPKTHQTYPNYGFESTSVAVAPKLVESKCVPLESHLYSSYPDLDNYRYSSTGYLKEGKCNKIGTDVSNLAQNFTGAAYPSEEFNRTIPLKLPSDNPDNLPPISTERYLNFDYDSLALKYSASNVMDYTPSLGSHNASRLGYRKRHPESSNSAYMDKGKITASMEATHDLTRLSLEPNSTAKEHDIVKGYYTRQQASEPCDFTGYDTATDHYRNIYPSDFDNANDYEIKSLKPQLETLERRSVFSRLSKTAKVDKFYSMDDKSPSQLLNILAQRKKSWKKIASLPKSSRPSINHVTAFKRSNTWVRTKLIDDGLTKENKESTKASMDLSLKKIKPKSPIEDKDVESNLCSKNVDVNKFKPMSESTKSSDVLEGIHEAAMEVLVKNFKRRSVTQEKTGENAEKGKRRKLIRPSFCNSDMDGIGNEGSLAIEPCNNSTGISTCKEHFVADSSQVQDKNTDVSFDQNSERSIKAKPMEEVNNLASHIQHDTVEMAESSGFTAENKKSDASFGKKLNFGIKVEPMEEEERMVLSHTLNDKPNDTNVVAESSGFTAKNKKSDVSFGQKINTSIKVEPVEEEHMLLSQTHNDKPKDANEMAGGSGFTAENKKNDASFGQKLNTSIKVEPMEEENMLLPHIHNDNPNDTNEVVENSGYQIVDKKTEVNFDPKCNVSIKVEPMEEEHILTAPTQNDMHNETTEMVKSSGKDSEQVSNSSIANNAIVLGKKVASSQVEFGLKNISKSVISSLKENVNDVHLDDINAEIFQADFGAESTKSLEENTDINSFTLPNLCTGTDEVKERLENSSNKTPEEDTRINSDKPTSLSTNSAANKIKTTESEKISGTSIDLNEVATTDGVIAEEFRIEPDTAAGF